MKLEHYQCDDCGNIQAPYSSAMCENCLSDRLIFRDEYDDTYDVSGEEMRERFEAGESDTDEEAVAFGNCLVCMEEVGIDESDRCLQCGWNLVDKDVESDHEHDDDDDEDDAPWWKFW